MDIYIYIHIYICIIHTYMYVYMCVREREGEREELSRCREVKKEIAREGCDYNISPRYCYRSRRSDVFVTFIVFPSHRRAKGDHEGPASLLQC